MRYLGVKNNKVCVVSDKPIQNKDFLILEVPKELEHLDNTDLMISCQIKNGEVKSKLAKIKAADMRIAFVGNFQQSCGISTYHESLWPEIAKCVGNFKLFIEENDNPTGDIYTLGGQKLNNNQVSVCWKRGESLQKLVNELKEYNASHILLGHEFGIWPNAAYFISMMTQLAEFRTIVTAHSTFPYHKDKNIVEACFNETIVHLVGAKEALENIKQIKGRIHVIGHGCYSLIKNRLWNFYKTNHTILQAGFGFKYKSFNKTIEAIALLKDKYKDIFLTILFSESDFNKSSHQLYYNELIELIEKLGLEEQVGIIRGFQSENITESYLLTNKILCLPYSSDGEHFVYGSSGIARKGFSAQMPVISSLIPHFSDTPTIKCDTIQEIAEQIDLLFSDPKLYAAQVAKQNIFVEENSWEITAQRYIKVFES